MRRLRRSRTRRTVNTLARFSLVFALACACSPGTAHADGDPASDFLVAANVFVPFEASPTAPTVHALSRAIVTAYAAGYRIKVAVIATRIDLGSIPSLFNKPTAYAAFLGDELSTAYIGPLLIVMPAGYGIYDGRRSIAAEQAVLARLAHPTSAKPNDLLTSATSAVTAMLRVGALKSKDILKPFAQALAGSYANHVLTIRYYTYDDSGRDSVLVTVAHGRRALFTRMIDSAPASYTKVLRQTLRAPPGYTPAGTQVCLTATDATGNRSAPSCHKITQ